MDENFLKDRGRAMGLLDEMERHGRYFTFQIFSSAEAIRAFGVDNMLRLGVMVVWVGVESCSTRGNFEKNRGIDAHELVSELRDKGIITLTPAATSAWKLRTKLLGDVIQPGTILTRYKGGRARQRQPHALAGPRPERRVHVPVAAAAMAENLP